MIRIHYSNEIPKKDGEKVRIAGWVERIRVLGKIAFLVLRDRYGRVQVTTKDPEMIKRLKEVTLESFISVSGEVKLNKEARNGFEIFPTDIEIISKADVPLPLDLSGKIESTLKKRLDWRFIDLRQERQFKIFLFQSEIVHILEEFMWKNGFVRVFTSRLTNVPTEGGADYFLVKYFDKNAYLVQSPQLYKESVLASGYDRIYDLGFVYRAEPHHTPRHLCEYASFDLEMVTDNMEGIISFEEEMIRHLFKELKKRVPDILSFFNARIEIPKKIPRLTLEEINKILEKKGVETGDDLSPQGEKIICEYAKEKWNSEFVFVTEFPFSAKPFYVLRKAEDPSKAWSFDLLYRGIEITTGGLREHRYEERVKNIKEKGLDPKQFYHLNFFKYGMPPHGGLAIGIERLTMKILGLENVREAALLPRDPERLLP
ncbi:MAG: aspartate--tRNA(Asn) ligase [Candidatus Aenigmarchaeota archaeon]|nr:aspartate--tRNA(Asn) ligase [Candidatus Aenigmarchaeota archaeon]